MAGSFASSASRRSSSRSRRSSVALPAASYSPTGGSTTKTVTQSFDAFGNRIERDATVGGVSSVEKFVVDGWDTTKPHAIGTENFDTILDLDGAGAVTNRRLFGSGFDDMVGRQDAAGSVKWYATDRLGSVRQVFDNAGNVSGTTDYDAFGGFLGGVSVDRYAFTGREVDVSLGLQYSRGRMYDSATGRWMGEDPIRQAAGDANLYRYVGNAATNARDPSGHDDDEFDFFKLRKKVIPPSEAFQKTIDNLRKALEEQKEGGKLTKEQEQAISFYVLDVAEGQGTSILTPEQDKLLQQMLKSGIADKKHVEAILAVVTKQSMESAFERFKSYEMHGGRPVLQPPPNGSFSHTCTGGYGTIHGLIRGGGNTVPYEVWKKWLPQQTQEKPPSFSDTSALGRLQWAMARGIQEIPNEFAGQLKDLINNKEFKEAVALAALGALMLQLIPGAGQATNSAVFGFIFVRLVATVGFAAATAGLAEGMQQLAIYADLAWKAKNVEELELAAEAFAKAMIAFSGSVGASKAFKMIRPAKVLQSVVQRTKRILNGRYEYLHDSCRPGVATRELRALEETYFRETRKKPITKRRPPGENRDAGFDPETREIFIYDDVPPAFRDGLLAEELHHYQQVRDAGHLGKSLPEIEKIDPGFETRMEREVVGRIEGSGFKKYESRDYVPYTDVPRPSGVAGDTP